MWQSALSCRVRYRIQVSENFFDYSPQIWVTCNMLVGGVGGPGDGTVATCETRMTGLADHIELPVTHTGMLYSAKVAHQAAFFLRTGGFEHSPAC